MNDNQAISPDSRKSKGKIIFALVLIVISVLLVGWSWLMLNTALKDISDVSQTAQKPAAASPVISQPQSMPSASTASTASASEKVSSIPTQPVAEIGLAEEMMTKEELEEWKKTNRESMKVLERLEKQK